MLTHPGKEISAWNLVPGQKYYAIHNDSKRAEWFRGVFTKHWTNSAGYHMVRFDNAYYYSPIHSSVFRNPESHPCGLYWRIWPDGHKCQSFKYYRDYSINSAQKVELVARCVLRERRQYERGLTGATDAGIWIPRDLVREISLKYLTDSKVGCAGRWR